jgi:WD40 repeat protein
VIEYDLATGNERKVRNARHQPLAASSRQGLMAALTAPATVTVTDVWTARAVATLDLTGAGGCEGFCFDPAGRHFVCVHPTKVVVRDVATWAVVPEHPFQMADRASGYAIHPDLNTLYYRPGEPADDAPRTDRGGGLTAWDLARNRESFRTPDDPFQTYRVSPNGALVVTSDSRVIHLYSARTGDRVASLRGHKRGTPSFDFAPDGRLVSISSDGQLKTWDISEWSD